MQHAVSLHVRLFKWVLTAVGVAVLGYSARQLFYEPVSLELTLAFSLAMGLCWRGEFYVRVLNIRVRLTSVVVYLVALMLGPWMGSIFASADGIARSSRSARKDAASLGAAMAAMNLALLTAALAVAHFFGPLDRIVTGAEGLARGVLALGLLALVSCLIHSAIVATVRAVSQVNGPLRTWARDYVRSAPRFLTAAFAAGALRQVGVSFGARPLLFAVPALALGYLVYRLCLAKVEASHEIVDRLARLHLATIESLTMAIDAKDPASRGHNQRVRDLAEALGRAVGYPEHQMEGLKAAALLHDIGKLAIPEYILSKPGRLSESEFSKIMVHPVVGADILSNVEFPYDVVPVVKHHHERFDGSGYPDGLSGGDIPLGARILTVVDCYEALTTERSYRPRYTRQEAFAVMDEGSGSIFDPEILATFKEKIDSIEKALPKGSEPRVLAEGVGFRAIEPTTPEIRRPSEVTPTERAMANISAAQREVLSLYEISQTLGSTLKLSEVLPIVATKVEHISGFKTMVIYLAEFDRLKAVYASGENSERLNAIEMSVGDGAAGWAAERRTALLGGTPALDLRRPLGDRAEEYKTATALPLVHRDDLVGVLALYDEKERSRPPDEIRVLEAISLHAATAIHNALVFERTKESALTDQLTGLPNSRYMYSFFDQEKSRSQRHGYPLVLMMMDLDGFKKVNDTYGHHIGDEILRRVAGIARGQLRSGDTLIRYAGDEFVAVLHRATPATVAELKRRLQSAVEEFGHEVRPGKIARVGISIGYATYGADGKAIDELMEIADQRMYEDKHRRTEPGAPRGFTGQLSSQVN